MPKILFTLLVIVVCCLGCSSLKDKRDGYASDHGREKFSKKNQAAVRERMKLVKEELKKLKDHPWADSYVRGMPPFGSHAELVIAPKSGYAYTRHSCDCGDGNGPLLYDQNYGEVTWENGRLKLSPALGKDEYFCDSFSVATELIPISWGDYLYLVPADEIIDFCNIVNAGDAIFGTFFIRGTYPWKSPPPSGKPDVPEEYKPYLLEKPIEGEIITVGETKELRKRSSIENETVVTINKGRQDGVLPGMQFLVTNPEKIFAPIKLTKITNTESEGIIEQGFYKSMETGEQGIIGGKPQIGWSVSTRR